MIFKPIFWLLAGILFQPWVQAQPTPLPANQDPAAPAETRAQRLKPQLFAPGIISTGLNEREPVFSPDGKHCFYWIIVGNATVIMQSNRENGVWQATEVASFSGVYSDFEPCLSPDGNRMYFCSNPPLPHQKRQNDANIWVMEKQAGKWSAPTPLHQAINSPAIEFFPSVSQSGTLYFNRINTAFSESQLYRVAWDGAAFGEPQKLALRFSGPSVGANVMVSPDEQFLLYSEPTQGRIVVRFRQKTGGWSEAVPLDAQLPPLGRDDGLRLSVDGQKLFFSAAHVPGADGFWQRPSALQKFKKLTAAHLNSFLIGPQNGSKDIYWISSAIIQQAKTKASVDP